MNVHMFIVELMKKVEEIRLENARYLSKLIGGNAVFADKLDRSATQISRIIGKRPTTNIGSKMARHIEECFGKQSGWLDTEHQWNNDEIGLDTQPAVDNSHNLNILPITQTREVPILSWVQAGAFCYSETQILPYDCETILCPNKHASSKTFALRVVGDSMTAPFGRSYPEGTIIFVDPEKQAEPGNRVIACTAKGHTFKQLAINEFNELYLKPLNPSHQPIMEEGIQICGVVIGSYTPE